MDFDLCRHQTGTQFGGNNHVEIDFDRTVAGHFAELLDMTVGDHNAFIDQSQLRVAREIDWIGHDIPDFQFIQGFLHHWGDVWEEGDSNCGSW